MFSTRKIKISKNISLFGNVKVGFEKLPEIKFHTSCLMFYLFLPTSKFGSFMKFERIRRHLASDDRCPGMSSDTWELFLSFCRISMFRISKKIMFCQFKHSYYSIFIPLFLNLKQIHKF